MSSQFSPEQDADWALRFPEEMEQLLHAGIQINKILQLPKYEQPRQIRKILQNLKFSQPFVKAGFPIDPATAFGYETYLKMPEFLFVAIGWKSQYPLHSHITAKGEYATATLRVVQGEAIHKVYKQLEVCSQTGEILLYKARPTEVLTTNETTIVYPGEVHTMGPNGNKDNLKTFHIYWPAITKTENQKYRVVS